VVKMECKEVCYEKIEEVEREVKEKQHARLSVLLKRKKMRL